MGVVLVGPSGCGKTTVNKIKLTILLRDGLRKPVFNSRDTQEVPLEESVQMMDKIEKYLNTNTILEHFEYYDLRQENYEKSNPQLNQISTLWVLISTLWECEQTILADHKTINNMICF